MSTSTIQTTDNVLDTFSDPDLVPHGYLDTRLESYNPLTQQPELHSATSQLLSQLDHAAQDLTWRLEETMDGLKRSGPRLEYEVELLRSGVMGLASEVGEVPAKTTPTTTTKDGEANKPSTEKEAMGRLRQLDQVRQKMKQVAEVLAEAETAFADEHALTREITTLLDQNSAEGLEFAVRRVERLAELAQVWKGTGQYAARARVVSGLRKRVEEAAAAVTGSAPGALQQQQQQRQAAVAGRGSSPGPNQQQQEQDGYYGLLGQLRGRMGY